MALKPKRGQTAVQCQRLRDNWVALFKVMPNDPNLMYTEVKQAATSKLALLE